MSVGIFKKVMSSKKHSKLLCGITFDFFRWLQQYSGPLPAYSSSPEGEPDEPWLVKHVSTEPVISKCKAAGCSIFFSVIRFNFYCCVGHFLNIHTSTIILRTDTWMDIWWLLLGIWEHLLRTCVLMGYGPHTWHTLSVPQTRMYLSSLW